MFQQLPHKRLECRVAFSGRLPSFNLLENGVSGVSRLEDGVGIYEHDRPQDRRALIAAGAGTIFFAYYFAIVNGQPVSPQATKIDCLCR
jgi:hypothetical protein